MRVGQNGSGAALCVLGSGSGGNCSVLAVECGGQRRACLIDAGLSPRRTRRLMAEIGVRFEEVRAVLLTHLDWDHWRPEWAGRGGLAPDVPVLVHERHHAWGSRRGLLPGGARAFGGAFEPLPGVQVAPTVLRHDALGVAAFRFDLPSGATLGFATDVGRVTDDLVDHLRGVGVLAIESNYCRRMQVESDRPEFLKRRIMGGRGHLSNTEAARAAVRIGARHVVFLHLSRRCNRADLVAGLHAGAEYEFTISEQSRPTPWVPIGAGLPPAAAAAPAGLWESAS